MPGVLSSVTLLFVILSMAADPPPAPTRPVMSRKVLARIERGRETSGRALFSSDGRQVVHVDDFRVWWNGRIQDVEGVEDKSVKYSADSRHVAWIGRAKGGGKDAVWLDGHPRPKLPPPYDASCFGFSPGSPRLRYISGAFRGKYAVVDGRQVGPSFLDVGCPVFSANGAHVAFAASQRTGNSAGPNNGKVLVLDGVIAGKDAEGEVAFSSDGGRVAWTQSAYERRVVVDGVLGKEYDDIQWLTFSADGRHVAYWAELDDVGLLVVDGREIRPTGFGAFPLPNPLLSAKGERVVFAGRDDKDEMVLFVNEHPVGPAFDGVVLAAKLSPDGRGLAYVGSDAQKQSWVVQDGRRGKSYEEILARDEWELFSSTNPDSPHAFVDALVYSSDSRLLAYVAREGGKSFVVVNDREGARFDFIEMKSLHFSSGNKRVTFGARDGAELVWVEEQAE